MKTAPLYGRFSTVLPPLFVRSLKRPFIGVGKMLKRGWGYVKMEETSSERCFARGEVPLAILHDRVKAWGKTGSGVCLAGAERGVVLKIPASYNIPVGFALLN